MTEIRLHIVDLTLSATEKVLGQTVDAAINKRLVNEFIDKVEVAP
jgi:F0F1-type ATP synthase membrane subunit b/b'